MPTVIGLSDGTKIELEDSPREVMDAISDLSAMPDQSDTAAEAVHKIPRAYGDWLMLGDKDQTTFNPAHVVYVREAKRRSGQVVAH